MESESLPVLQSMQNPRVKHAIRLRDSRFRRRSGEFLIDGLIEIERARAAGIALGTVFVLDGDPSTSQRLLATAPQNALPLQPVSEVILQRMSYGEQSAKPVAIARTPRLELSHLRLTNRSLVLVLDRIEKPGNLGACLRTASACGIDAVVLTDAVCEVFNPNTIRASRGTVFSVPMAQCTAGEFVAQARSLELPLAAARIDGKADLWQCDFRGGSAIVFGNEAEGLGDEWRTYEEQGQCHSFRIPMHAQVDSLNVSTSAAVALYEALRQRRGV
jgi:TrmH family RNA methyltransferase